MRYMYLYLQNDLTYENEAKEEPRFPSAASFCEINEIQVSYNFINYWIDKSDPLSIPRLKNREQVPLRQKALGALLLMECNGKTVRLGVCKEYLVLIFLDDCRVAV